MFEKAIRLLRTAGILLVIAGCIFGLIEIGRASCRERV